MAADFEKRTGVHLQIDFINSNEEVMRRLLAGERWDVWTPSGSVVQEAAAKGLLARLPASAIPNLGKIGRRFLNPAYDPELLYSAPFYWGTTGLGYDRRAFSEPPASWGYLFDPRLARPQSGKISLLNDPRDALGAALIYLGLPPNSTDAGELARARDLLEASEKNFAAIDSESYLDRLAAGRVVLAQGWSGDLARLAARAPHLAFTLPREGYLLWIDNLSILASSDAKEAAAELLNFLLEPAVAARLSNENRTAVTVAAALPLLDSEVRDGPSYQLPEGVPYHIVRGLGPARALVDRFWLDFTRPH